MKTKHSSRPSSYFVNPPLPLASCLLWTVTIAVSIHIAQANMNMPKFFSHLKTFQKTVCDGEMLQIKCPRNTSIAFSSARYGRNATYNQVCPSSSRQANDDTTCIWKGALNVLVDLCRTQQECKLNPSKEFKSRDPCPHVRKSTDVTYQCRPNMFLHKTVCSGEKMILKCQGKQRRLLIFSAFFGATKLGVAECPQHEDITRECQQVGATDTVIGECQGRRRCQLAATQDKFGKIICVKQAAVFLRVVYTCVSRDILKEYENDVEDPDISTTEDTTTSHTPSTTTPTPIVTMTTSTTPVSIIPTVPTVLTAVTTHRLPPYEPRAPLEETSVSTIQLPNPPNIIYNVPKPGSAGEDVKLHTVIDGSANGKHKTSMSTSSHDTQGSSNASTEAMNLIIQILNALKSTPKSQLIVYSVGVSLCLCLVFSMVCLVGSIQRGKRKKQARKKLVVLSPEFDDLGAEDGVAMSHIAPPTLTSTLHRASQGSLLGTTATLSGTLHRSSQGATLLSNGTLSNQATIRRIPSDTHPRAPQGNFYYS